MRAKILTKVVMSVLVVMWALSLCAQKSGFSGKNEPGSRKGGHGGRGLLMMLAELDLTDDQIQKVADIMKASRSSSKATQEKMHELRQENQELTEADSFDEKAVRENAKKIADLNVEMMVANAKMMHEIKSVLTPEQKERLKMKKTERIEKMQQMKENMAKFKRMMKGQKEKKMKKDKNK